MLRVRRSSVLPAADLEYMFHHNGLRQAVRFRARIPTRKGPWPRMRQSDGDWQDPVPSSLESLLALIAARRPALPARLGQVAEFALTHPEDVAFGTAAQVAAAAGVQPSTLVRFAQSLGYDGFSALQAVFQRPFRHRLGTERRAAPTGPESSVFLDAAAAVTAAAHLPLDRFAAAVAILARAETIHLVARRRAFPITSYMAYAFGRMRIRCELGTTPMGIEDEILDMAGQADAAIAVSFAPYAPETLRRVDLLRAHDVPVVALTDGVQSPLMTAATQAFALPETHGDDARSLPAGMAFAVALTRAVAQARRSGGR